MPKRLAGAAFDDMREGQIGKQALLLRQAQQLRSSFGKVAERGKAVHHAFRRAGRSRGVNDGGEITGSTQRATGKRRAGSYDIVPRGVPRGCSGGKLDAVDIRWNAATCHLFLVRGAQEASFGLTVLQNVPRRAAIQRWVDGHAHMPGHPYGQIRHDPPSAVAGEYRHPRFRLPVLRLQVSCHAAHFGGDLPPGPLAHLPTAKRLGEKDALRPLALPAIESREREILFHYVVHVCCPDCAPSALDKGASRNSAYDTYCTRSYEILLDSVCYRRVK